MPPFHGGQRTQYTNLAQPDVESKSEEMCGLKPYQQRRLLGGDDPQRDRRLAHQATVA